MPLGVGASTLDSLTFASACPGTFPALISGGTSRCAVKLGAIVAGGNVVGSINSSNDNGSCSFGADEKAGVSGMTGAEAGETRRLSLFAACEGSPIPAVSPILAVSKITGLGGISRGGSAEVEIETAVEPRTSSKGSTIGASGAAMWEGVGFGSREGSAGATTALD